MMWPILETSLVMLGLAGIAGYLLGSVPFGIIVSRLMGLGDPRRIGSGNIGATNVLRSGSKVAAALTLMGDGAKGAAAVLLARALLAEDAAQAAGLGAFLGHLFPIFLGLRGGKGVATFLGVTLALAWPVGIVVCIAWIAAAAILRISSAAALVAAVVAPVTTLLMGPAQAFAVLAIMALLVVERHRGNIGRLLRGEEPRIGSGRSGAPR